MSGHFLITQTFLALIRCGSISPRLTGYMGSGAVVCVAFRICFESLVVIW